MRKWHYLRGNHTTRTGRSFVFVDTETEGDQTDGTVSLGLHTLKLGVAIHVRLERERSTRREVFRFATTDDFWGWFYSRLHKSETVQLWAHNLGFDLTVLRFWNELEAGTISATRMVLEDPPTVIRGRYYHGRFVALDTLNWWRCSLAQLGADLELPKLTMPGSDSSRDEWYQYCERDASIVEKAVLGLVQFCRRNDLGVMRATAAGQAMAAYRHRFVPTETVPGCPDRSGPSGENVQATRPVILIHAHTDALELERACYFGGQTECYFIGLVGGRTAWTPLTASRPALLTQPRINGPVHHLDVNSLFPSLMANHDYPVKLAGFVERGSIDQLTDLLKSFCVCASVRLHTRIPYPVRLGDGMVIYAVGTFWTSLCTPELERAKCEGALCDVGRLAFYERGKIFDDYVQHFWRARLAAESVGDNATAGICKLMMNSLYGKFGQKGSRWSDRPEIVPPHRWGPFGWTDYESGESWACRAIAGRTQARHVDGEAHDSFPAIAAHVTSFAREHMYELRDCVGARNCYYQAVDSLHVNQLGLDRLAEMAEIDDRVLGHLRHEATYNRVEYCGLNHWVADGASRIAGLSPRSQRTGEDTWRITEFERLDSIVSQLPLPGVNVTSREATFRPIYRHGIAGPDGWVSPIKIGGMTNAELSGICGPR